MAFYATHDHTCIDERFWLNRDWSGDVTEANKMAVEFESSLFTFLCNCIKSENFPPEGLILKITLITCLL